MWKLQWGLHEPDCDDPTDLKQTVSNNHASAQTRVLYNSIFIDSVFKLKHFHSFPSPLQSGTFGNHVAL